MRTIHCIIDGDGWVQEKRLQLLRGFFRNEYRMKEVANVSAAALLARYLPGWYYYVFSWRRVLTHGLLNKLPLERCMTSVTSHYNIGGGLSPDKALGKGEADEGQALRSAVEVLRRFKVVTVNSMRLYEMLSPHVPDIIYAPNGVDHVFFSPSSEGKRLPRPLTIGWTGKIKEAKNYDLVCKARELCSRNGIVFKEHGVDKNAGRVRNAEYMREFYRSLDYYLCVSWHEGTPNPCLEAAACGVPLITTRVGNMPELVKDGENGFFIEPDIASISCVLDRISDIPGDNHASMGASIRTAVERNWTWQSRIDAYRLAFNRLMAKEKGA